jgi:hypothetical protein
MRMRREGRVIYPLQFFSTGIFLDLIITGTQVMKSINEVPLYVTATVFGITVNLLAFTI